MQAYQEIELAKRTHHPVLRPTAIQVGRELEVLSQLMDNQFQVPVIGWRFGLNAVIDLIPEFGDIATTIVASWPGLTEKAPEAAKSRVSVGVCTHAQNRRACGFGTEHEPSVGSRLPDRLRHRRDTPTASGNGGPLVVLPDIVRPRLPGVAL